MAARAPLHSSASGCDGEEGTRDGDPQLNAGHFLPNAGVHYDGWENEQQQIQRKPRNSRESVDCEEGTRDGDTHLRVGHSLPDAGVHHDGGESEQQQSRRKPRNSRGSVDCEEGTRDGDTHLRVGHFLPDASVHHNGGESEQQRSRRKPRNSRGSVDCKEGAGYGDTQLKAGHSLPDAGVHHDGGESEHQQSRRKTRNFRGSVDCEEGTRDGDTHLRAGHLPYAGVHHDGGESEHQQSRRKPRSSRGNVDSEDGDTQLKAGHFSPDAGVHHDGGQNEHQRSQRKPRYPRGRVEPRSDFPQGRNEKRGNRSNNKKWVPKGRQNSDGGRDHQRQLEKRPQDVKLTADSNKQTKKALQRTFRKHSKNVPQPCSSVNQPTQNVQEAPTRKKSKVTRRSETKLPPTLSTPKQCRLIITPSKAVSPEIMNSYLQNCLGNVMFELEDVKTVENGASQFTFVFQSTNQGRKAEQVMKKIAELGGVEMVVSILKEETSTIPHRLLDECERELREKISRAVEQHARKIEDICGKLGRLRLRKHVSLNEFERVRLEKEALNQKKLELDLQMEEFKIFANKVIETVNFLKSQERASVEHDIKELRKAFGRELHRLDAALPMYAKKSKIIDIVNANQVSIVLGETGSGKSTQMTQYLYEAGLAKGGLIVCTQPRKVAATSLAGHVAREMGGVVGQIVGCHVGGRSQTSKITAIVYATDHVLLNECLSDPALSKYSCIIIDEAHERSIYSDLLLGMIKRCLVTRPELRVVITSATIDPELFVAYFNQCPVLKVSGRMFPVDVIWKDGPSNSSERYLQEAVNTVRKIHHQEEPGDVLVFLTSPAETERACEVLANSEPDPNLFCLPLHGKLRQEEQRKVFEELDANQRKVVFSTNCAETSITIPGIKYVVDTGMVKEMKYEPKRNKSSLEVTTINKSSAEQRKGRAGRTQAGKCYRLYSEEAFAAMEVRSTPEILRVHLGQAVLKLMELGIDNVSKFQFVESPPLDSIEEASKVLESLGAIASGKLTELGHKMARVPVEPRLAKLIFDGIDEGVGPEALSLAAIATVNGSVFFRMGSDEEKQRADSRKVGFCHDGGDLLTLLEVYRQYLKEPKGKRNKWCFKNSLNAKSLRVTEETIKELKLALKHELRMEVTDPVQQDSNPDLKLQRILLSCYVSNLCVFTGHEKAGYRVASFNQCVHLHPSSALKFLGATPQLIVFDQLLKTSRDFALNVTPVEETWLREMISKGVVQYDLDDLMSTVLEPVVLPCSPDLMNATLGGPRGKMLEQVEEKVAKACGDSLVVLEKNKELGHVKIFVQPRHTIKALSVVGSQLEEGRQKFRNEQREEQLKEECQGVRVVLGQGGTVQELLMPDMYRNVTVGDIENGCVEGVIAQVSSFGEVAEHRYKYQGEKMRVFVTFKSSEDAAKAVKESIVYDLKVQPGHSPPNTNGAHTQISQFKVKAKWTRRHGKGTGSVAFNNSEDFVCARNRLHTLRIGFGVAGLQPDKRFAEQIFMTRLDCKASEEDVRTAFARELPGVTLKKVFINRTPGFDTDDQTVECQKKYLQETLSEFSPEGKFSVYLRKPTSKAVEGFANLTFQDAEEGQEAVRRLTGRDIAGIGVVTLHPDLSTTFLCPQDVYTAIESELETTVKELHTLFGEHLKIKTTKRQDERKGRVAIHISSTYTDHFIPATAAVSKTIEGDRIDCTLSKTLEVLLTKETRHALLTIQKDTGTVIFTDWRNKVVRIHGGESNREAAKRAINKFLDDSLASDSQPWQIDLRGADNRRGLLKALFIKFGEDLQGLQNIPGVQNIHVDFQRHLLKIQSTCEARETIERYVQECCESLPQESSGEQYQFTCGICLCSLDDTAEVYRLACCGHAYDKSCVAQQLKSKDFPLKCVEEECGELFVWKDLLNLLSQSQRRKLAFSALDEYVKANPDKAKYCPTTDCGMTYRVSTEGKRLKCGACLNDTCTSCHVQYHNGLTCAMFQSEKRDEGKIEKWMAGDATKRKQCPKCRVPIEKTEGCNHMTCTSCNTHMCWLCLQMFASGDAVYDHLPHCPKKNAV